MIQGMLPRFYANYLQFQHLKMKSFLQRLLTFLIFLLKTNVLIHPDLGWGYYILLQTLSFR